MQNTSNNLIEQEPVVSAVQQGQGAPVIFIHGLAASLFDWKDALPAISRAGYAGHAIDLLGHGWSQKPANIEDYTVEQVYSHFWRWVESLELSQPAVLVGHSLGGYLAMQAARRSPDSVKALVLLSPFFSRKQLPRLLQIRYHGPLINTVMIQHTPQWLIRSIIDLTSLSIRNGYVLPEDVRAQTAEDYKRSHPAIFNIPGSMEDLSEVGSGIPHPVLVAWGKRDVTLTPASFPPFAARFPHAQTAELPGGHVPHQSHPQDFNQALLSFLASLS